MADSKETSRDTINADEAANQAAQRIEDLMQDHEKHYRGLCHWIVSQRKRRGRHGFSACEMMADMLGEGHTVATAIWNKYKPEGEKDYA